MSEIHNLTLNADSLRSGIDGLQLSATPEGLLSNLTRAHWQKPVCESGKTSLRSKGRLFQTQHCVVGAKGTVVLQGLHVEKLDLFLLDQQLVRIDVVLAKDSADQVSGHTGTQLSDLLEDTYHQAGVAFPGTQNKAAWQWRRQNDQIRLYPGHSLQFIDDRLETSLPALYGLESPFVFE